MLHPGERVLIERFWMPTLPVQEIARRTHKELGFVSEPPATAETLRDLGECLVERASVDEQGAMHVYRLVGQILDQSDSLYDEWLGVATRVPVYRAFRQQERQLNSRELFIGDGDYKEDLSTRLLCLKASPALPTGLIKLYRKLGIPERPTLVQVVAALSAVEATEPNARSSHARLVQTFEELTRAPDAPVDEASLTVIRVLTCAGTYEPVSSCYWDEEFGRRDRVLGAGAVRLIDTTDKSTRKLVVWLHERRCEALVPLRAAAKLEPHEGPPSTECTPEFTYLLLPWQQWFQEAVREGSLLKEKLMGLGLTPPKKALKLVPVERVRVDFRLQDGQVIEQAPRWKGPLALGVAGQLFVRAEAGQVDQIDGVIASEVAILFGSPSVVTNPKLYVDEILATLERPATVLRRLRETYRQHFLHQYHDQVADPEFVDLFDEYQRTHRGSKRAEQLEDRMHALLAKGFVRGRIEQIRGYGYDEYSVFTELLQNAEDAYIQRAQLGMEMPESCDIAYRYCRTAEGTRILDVEHHGRPFNYWQHGARQHRSFSRDVEGVLRSAGSFKPHSGGSDVSQSEVATIGRFGLGFKSVYLLTDRPEIHSGFWHFAIEAGCLPEELPPPADLQPDVTRIRLQLRADARDLDDAAQLMDLLPFLQMTTRLVHQSTNGDNVELNVTSDPILKEPILVERVVISRKDSAGDGVRLLRCRSRENAGQLAVLLSQDGTLARWSEAFKYDLFAVLPLKAQLGCGVAASHRFEVQSGRTHLVDPEANRERFLQAAALLEGLVEGLRAFASTTTPLSTLLARFWALWRWDRGDVECEPLRKALARALVGLADRMPVVPTLDPKHPVALAEGPCFFFYELPDTFRDALVAEQVCVPIEGFHETPLASANVVVEGFAAAYRRACEYAGVRRAQTLAGIGWDEVAAIFRETPWFAERPKLLSCLAGCLSEEQLHKVAAWVALCRVRGEDGRGGIIYLLPGELLPAKFLGMQHLPRRLLRRLSTAYDQAAVELLRRAGLCPRPSSDDIRMWVQGENLTANECVSILRYLAEDSRFREDWDLAPLFQSPWFPDRGTRLSTANAADRGLVPDDVLESDVFRAWLGLSEGPEPEPAPVPPPCDPRQVLHRLFEWWQRNGALWTSGYEGRLYPKGRPPTLRGRFNLRDLAERREWMTLFLLGALHSMGRTQFEQHREFLRRCDRKGWLDVFADGGHDAWRWMQVLEEYLDEPPDTQDYYQWMKQFVAIFQVSRWLSEYVESFLNVNRITQPFALDQIIALRRSEFFSGGGPDAPALTRTLRMGACFVLRELARLGVLRQPHAHPHCYVAPRRVCDLLEALGCVHLRALPTTDRSSAIHAFLVDNIGAEQATFGLTFDLPLLALADNPDLQGELLGHVLPRDEVRGDPYR